MSHMPAQRERPRLIGILLVAVAIATAGCVNGHNGNGKKRDTSWSAEEREALARMDRAVALAEKLIDNPEVSPEDKARLREVTRNAWFALDRYRDLRRRGVARATALAGIGVAAAAIAANDVTVVGVADDVSLVPLAIAAMVTIMVTDAAASDEVLTQAWLQVAQRIREVGTTVDDIVHRTAPGRQADTGIMAEVYEWLRSQGLEETPPNVCQALRILWEAANRAKDTKRRKRVETTQKAYNCRHSRHSGRRK